MWPCCCGGGGIGGGPLEKGGGGGCIGPFILEGGLPILPLAWAGAGGRPEPRVGGPTCEGGPLANSVCGLFLCAFGLLDANIRSAIITTTHFKCYLVRYSVNLKTS